VLPDSTAEMPDTPVARGTAESVASDSLAALLERGSAIASKGNRAGAVGSFKAALTIDPANMDALLWLCWLSENPRSSVYYAILGVSYEPQNPRATAALEWARNRLRVSSPERAQPPRRILARAAAALPLSAGILLLAVGTFRAYPYVHSRLVAAVQDPRTAASPSETRVAPVENLGAATPTPPHSTPFGVSKSVTRQPNQVPQPPGQSHLVGHTLVPDATSQLTATLPPAAAVPAGKPAGRPLRIVIPDINLDAPVMVSRWITHTEDGMVRGAWEVPDVRAAGWHENSAPLGQPGNTVLNGHNTTRGEVFRDLYTLNPGNGLIAYAGTMSYTYSVSETIVLREYGEPLEVRVANARFIMPTSDERLTLVTCHPYGSLQNRLVVIARPLADNIAQAGP
jgi:LPXTG-site transpeptidase (sortase) family protein